MYDHSWTRGSSKLKWYQFRLRSLKNAVGIVLAIFLLAYFHGHVVLENEDKDWRRSIKRDEHRKNADHIVSRHLIVSQGGMHSASKYGDPISAQLDRKKGIAHLKLKDVLVISGFKSNQLRDLPTKVLELLFEATLMGIQRPRNPWLCTDRPDSLLESNQTRKIASDAVPKIVLTLNESSMSQTVPHISKVRFRDSTVDFEDCSLFMNALGVVSPFDSPAAARSAAKTKGTYIPKVAFLFLVRGSMPFVKVWQRFFTGQEGRYSVYVHATPGYTYEEKDGPFFGREVRSRKVYWGTISVVDAFRRLLASALLDPLNARFMFLSESDIPIRGFDFVYNYLVGSRESFVGGPHRCIKEKDLGILVIGRPTMAYWRHGEAWFEVNRKHARVLVEDWKYFERGLKYCKLTNSPTCVLDENLLQTILAIKDEAHVANRTVMSVDWSAMGAHPRMYFPVDITDELVLGLQAETSDEKHSNIVMEVKECYRNGVRAPCWLFARKFHHRSQNEVLALSNSSLGY